MLIFYVPCVIIIEYEVLCSALVAQGIEQRFPVPCVGGSNPLGCIFIVIRGTAAQRWIPCDGMRKYSIEVRVDSVYFIGLG